MITVMSIQFKRPWQDWFLFVIQQGGRLEVASIPSPISEFTEDLILPVKATLVKNKDIIKK